MKRQLARSLVADYRQGTVTVDRVTLPWWLEAAGPQVDTDHHPGITLVHLPLLVAGVVEVRNDDGHRTFYDPEVGEVGAFARQLVRQGMLDRSPWLAGVV